MEKADLEKNLFRYGMWWRIFYGSLRITVALILYKLVNVPFSDLLYKIMSHELVEDPSDLLFQLVNSFLQLHPFTVTNFIVVYLIFWGAIDIIFSVALLKHKLWAFPLSLGLIGFFIVYELYRFWYNHSLILLSVVVIDILIAYLIWREYNKAKVYIWKLLLIWQE